jgi:PucR-like helix-turn-helix protein
LARGVRHDDGYRGRVLYTGERYADGLVWVLTDALYRVGGQFRGEARHLPHSGRAEKEARLFALADYERQMTIETINAFADASMKVIRAAAALHVHPNTVRLPARPDQRSFDGLTDLQCISEIGALLYVLTECVEMGRKLSTTL